MLVDTLLIPRFILPYLSYCIKHALILNERTSSYSELLGGDGKDAELALDSPYLVKGIASSIRTLIIASFRAPATQYVMSLLRRLNPTASIMKATKFVSRHDYIYSLLCLLNINMGGLDLGKTNLTSSSFIQDSNQIMETYRAHALLYEMAALYSSLDKEKQTAIYRRVMSSGALPIARDTPSYLAIMSVLHGGAAGQLDYLVTG